MKTNKPGRTPMYDNAFKIAVSREYLTSNLSKGALAKKYGLSSGTIDGFVRWYKKHYSIQVDEVVKDTVSSVPEGLNAKELSEQLKQANLKIAGLEMLIETAQKELGIDIIKKSGTKQSLK